MSKITNWLNQNGEKTAAYSIMLLFVVAIFYKMEAKKERAPEKDNSEEVATAVKTTWINVYSVSESAYVTGCQQGFERTCKLLKAKEQKSCIDYSGSYCKDAAKDYRKKATAILSTGH